MSRVTINALANNLTALWICKPEENAKIEAVKNIEIVPRKMVEMIIERIESNKAVCEPDGYAEHILDNISMYAESLLKRFEEER